MFRILLQRRWLIALAAATAFFVLCVFLGRWQWGRHVERSTFAAAVTRNYEAPPTPLGQALPHGELSADAVWTTVRTRGSYVPEKTLYVRNRPQNVTYGYEILVPFRADDGSTVLVDRGWVKNAETAEVLPQVPPAPAGDVEVTGWLRAGEAALGRDLPAGQLASIDLGEAAAETGLPVHTTTYVVLASERAPDGGEPARPAPLLPPDTDTGPHFAYALQWWGGSITGFVLVAVYARREWRDRQEAAGAPVAPKPKKRRIWDEEAE